MSQLVSLYIRTVIFFYCSWINVIENPIRVERVRHLYVPPSYFYGFLIDKANFVYYFNLYQKLFNYISITSCKYSVTSSPSSSDKPRT